MALDAVWLAVRLLRHAAEEDTKQRMRRDHLPAEHCELTLPPDGRGSSLPPEGIEQTAEAPPLARFDRVAALCGEHLSPLVISLGEISSDSITKEGESPDVHAAKGRLQRALGSLLATLLLGAKPGAGEGDPELAALRPLLGETKSEKQTSQSYHDDRLTITKAILARQSSRANQASLAVTKVFIAS